MFLVEKTSRRRTYKIDTSLPIFGLIMALLGMFVTLAANLAAGGLIILWTRSLPSCVPRSGSSTKENGRVERTLNLMQFSVSLWQRPLDEIAEVEIKGTITRVWSGYAHR